MGREILGCHIWRALPSVVGHGRSDSRIGLTFGGDIFTAVAFLIGNGLERNLAAAAAIAAAMDVIYRSRNSIAAPPAASSSSSSWMEE